VTAFAEKDGGAGRAQWACAAELSLLAPAKTRKLPGCSLLCASVASQWGYLVAEYVLVKETGFAAEGGAESMSRCRGCRRMTGHGLSLPHRQDTRQSAGIGHDGNALNQDEVEKARLGLCRLRGR